MANQLAKAMHEIAKQNRAIKNNLEVEPLPIEKLREMEGDKVSIHFIGSCEGFYKDVTAPYYGSEEQYIGREDGSLVAVHLPLRGYMQGWVAYRPQDLY